jgi:hypothetical protein
LGSIGTHSCPMRDMEVNWSKEIPQSPFLVRHGTQRQPHGGGEGEFYVANQRVYTHFEFGLIFI